MLCQQGVLCQVFRVLRNTLTRLTFLHEKESGRNLFVPSGFFFQLIHSQTIYLYGWLHQTGFTNGNSFYFSFFFSYLSFSCNLSFLAWKKYNFYPKRSFLSQFLSKIYIFPRLFSFFSLKFSFAQFKISWYFNRAILQLIEESRCNSGILTDSNVWGVFSLLQHQSNFRQRKPFP